MISEKEVVFIILAYLLLLFLIASLSHKIARKNKNLISNPWIYALSISVYCTAWTYYGSVGKAATDGVLFITTFLGPALFIPIWFWLTEKMVRISQHFRISSLADFISSRYGNSSFLGGFVAIFCVVAILPYIAIQLKAIGTGFDILVGQEINTSTISRKAFYNDSNFYLTGILALFVMIFGTRNIETATKNHGLVSVIAFEAIIKLVAFLSVGIFVCYFIFNDIGDIFSQAAIDPKLAELFVMKPAQLDEWFANLSLSFLAVLFLPRQFQTAVLENNNENYLRKAVWIFPLYLLIINLFVLPIAIGGKLLLGSQIDPDTFVLTIPLINQNKGLAIFSYIGGFSASASMIIVSVFALTNMLSNNVVMPIIAKRNVKLTEISKFLLATRRVGIFLLMLLAYSYYKLIANNYSLVSTGLISFAGVVQFAPITLLGMYWKTGNKKAAISALTVGVLLWFYILIIPNLAQIGLIPKTVISNGLFGISFLKPENLFGFGNYSPVISCFLISMFLNTLTYILVSIYTKQSETERRQAALFVDIKKYLVNEERPQIWNGNISTDALKDLLQRVLGNPGADKFICDYQQVHGNWQSAETANPKMIPYVETVLASAVGTASARILISSVTEDEKLKFEDLIDVARESKELLLLNKKLKQQSEELEKATDELKKANEKLLMLDSEKDIFISTVTHELRTPITSIRSFSEILYDNEDLTREEQAEFLKIIVRETERISRLISQVLDLEKLQSGTSKLEFKLENLTKIAIEATDSLNQQALEKNLQLDCQTDENDIFWNLNKDRITQVIINLLTNAIRYHDKPSGKITLHVSANSKFAMIKVSDNGPGMEKAYYEKVFEKFYQIRKKDNIKDKGVGLGLAITKSIVDKHYGQITIDSNPGNGTTISVNLPKIE